MVLLILAAVAIGLSVGDNGIITSARNATDQWEQGVANEQDELKQIANFINSNGNNEGESGAEGEKVEGVTIPNGFYYVGGTRADGIVISDNVADENKYKEQIAQGNSQIPGDGLVGNQFVWVPVDNFKDFKRYDSYWDNEITDKVSSCYEPAQEGYRYDGEVEEYNSMMTSVEKNHGFYVARYEAGKEQIEGVDTVVSKKGASVWNFIAWGDSMTSIGTEGAVAKAKGMYTDREKYAVTSTLIYGTQWDAIMAWIDPAYKTSSCQEDSFVRNSTGKGNYSGEELSCGSSDDYRVNNIYDLAGNVAEWSMETDGNITRQYRGAYCSLEGSYAPASARSNYWIKVDNKISNIGFRVALYL